MKRKGMLIFLLVAALPILLAARSPRERALLEIAVRVAKKGEFDRYCWRSNRELILVRGFDTVPNQAFLLDSVTGKQTPLTGLQKALNFAMEDATSTSPDGKWLLCTPFNVVNPVYAISLNDAVTRKWNVECSPNRPWIPGTSRWMHLASDLAPAKVTVYDAARPKEKRTLAVTSAVSISPHFLQDILSLPASPPVVTPDNRLLALFDEHYEGPFAPFTTTLHLAEFRIEPSRLILLRTKKLRTFVAPKNLVAQPVISSQGDRVAWFQSTSYTPSGSRFRKRLNPEDTTQGSITTLHVMRLKGSGERTIGKLDADIFSENLQWRPDGKALSFVCKRNLYTVAVD